LIILLALKIGPLLPHFGVENSRKLDGDTPLAHYPSGIHWEQDRHQKNNNSRNDIPVPKFPN
jgi:hypothetical protein